MIDKNGKYTADLTPGNYWVKAEHSESGLIAKAFVSVQKSRKAESLKIEPVFVTLEQNQKQKFTVEGYDINRQKISTQLRWFAHRRQSRSRGNVCCGQFHWLF